MNLYKAKIKKSHQRELEIHVPAKNFEQAEKRIQKATYCDPVSIELVCETYDDWRGGLIYD